MYVNPTDLKKGDRFIEDTYPEIWEVTETGVQEQGLTGVRAKVVGNINKKSNPTSSDVCFWGGLGMCLIMWNSVSL